MDRINDRKGMRETVVLRLQSRLPWLILGVTWVLALASFPLAIRLVLEVFRPGTMLYQVFPRTFETPLLEFLGWHLDLLLPPLAYVTLGSFIVMRQPRNRIGWLFCAIGFFGAVKNITGYYAFEALAIRPEIYPGGLASAWINNWVWVIELGMLYIFLPLLFPNGRLLSPRWKWVGWLAAWAMGVIIFITAFQPGYLGGYIASLKIENPFVIDWTGQFTSSTDILSISSRIVSAAGYFSIVLAILTLLGAVLSLVWRLLKARREERQQIKWFAYFAVLLGLLFLTREIVRNLLGQHTPFFEALFEIPWLAASLGLPISAGLAVLKYHLYHIDILIRRTLVYSILTAILAGIYLASVIALQSGFRLLTGQAGQSPAAVVLSTLAIAALFTPLRQGIQTVIDRRFYRSKINAEQALADFSAMLREEVELETIANHLMAISQKAMQPEMISLWLKKTGQLPGTGPVKMDDPSQGIGPD